MDSPVAAVRPRSPWVLIPPPPLLAAAFIAGVQLDRLVPIALVAAAALPVARAAGIALVVAGTVLIVAAPLLFLVRRTTIVPHASARTLITGGPFRLTRNPMYLGLVALYAGAALLWNVLWPLALLAAPLWVLQRKVIPFEEATLSRVFGAEYEAYRGRVRRWL